MDAAKFVGQRFELIAWAVVIHTPSPDFPLTGKHGTLKAQLPS